MAEIDDGNAGMNVAFGIVVVLLALLAWVGQTISWLAPAKAVELSLMEAEDAVEPTFFADIRGEARWDACTLWTLVAAGVLLVVDHAAWPYFGLVGGGMYLYFSGRGILTRTEMQRRGLRIGTADSVRAGLTFLAVWGVMAAAMIVGSVTELRGR